MGDRWNPKVVETEAERPVKVFVPGGDASSAVEPRGKTWGIRRRGDTESTVVHAYRCPVHGVVDVRVQRGEVPDVLNCAELAWYAAGGDFPYASHEEAKQAAVGAGYADPEVASYESKVCGLTATWCGSFAGAGHASGEVTS